MTWNEIAQNLIKNGSPAQLSSLSALLEASGGERLQSLAVLRFLETLPGDLVELTDLFRALGQTCGSWPAAKLALSLAEKPLAIPLPEFREALRSNHCVPAAMRLCSALMRSDCQDPSRRLMALETAALLTDKGKRQESLLKPLLDQNTPAPLLTALLDLARQLNKVSWASQGSWGYLENPERGLVYNDGANPEQRESFGMTLTSEPIRLDGQIRSKLSFWLKLEIFGLTDRCHLEISSDGGREWTKLLKFDGQCDWTRREVDLSDYDGRTVLLRFHVLSGHDRKGGGVYLDRLSLSGVLPERSLPLFFDGEGWDRDGVYEGQEVLWSCTEPDRELVSAPVELSDLKLPTLLLNYTVRASSVYENCQLFIRPQEQEWQLLRQFDPQPGERQCTLDLEAYQGQTVQLRFQSNLKPRRPADGVRLTRIKLVGSRQLCHRIQTLDGSPSDGPVQREAVCRLLEDGQYEELLRLHPLTGRLHSVACALEFLPHLRNDEDLKALLLLHLAFKDQASSLFEQLRAQAGPQDSLERLARLMILTKPGQFNQTLDLLGEGLLPAAEVEPNIDLFVELAEHWDRGSAEASLSQVMIPIAGETLQERREAFRRLKDQFLEEPERALKAWGTLTRWTGNQSLAELVERFVNELAESSPEEVCDRLARSQRTAAARGSGPAA